MKRILLVLLAIFVIFGTASAESLYYDEINMSVTIDEFLERFPEAIPDPTEADGEAATVKYRIEDEAEVFFFAESGRLQAKSLYFSAPDELCTDLIAKDLSGYAEARPKESYEKTCNRFGCAGTEIIRINESDADDSPVQIVYLWMDEGGNSVQAVFDSSLELVYINYSERS